MRTATSAGGHDPIKYDLFHSADGGAIWSPVAVNLTATSYEWDTSQVGGTDAGRVRVSASDGLHVTMDESDGGFSVTRKSPTATISSPQEGASVALGEAMMLRGSAHDPEDGTIPGTSLTWNSSLDGALGSGEQIVTDALSPGLHVIELTAIDLDGNVTLDSVFVTVGATPDSDGDGTTDDVDNCLTTHNTGQGDSDGDMLDDACDNCPVLPNAEQSDSDSDGVGDSCDCAPSDGSAFGMPPEVQNVTFIGSVTLEWQLNVAAAGVGLLFDVVRGSIGELPVGGGSSDEWLTSGGTANTL